MTEDSSTLSDEGPLGDASEVQDVVGGVAADLERRIAQLESVVSQREAATAELRRQIARLTAAHAALTRAGKPAAVESRPRASVPARSVPPGRATNSSALIREHAEAAIRRTGRPLSREEIHAEMQAAGVTLSNPDALRLIRKVLWKDPRFERIGNRFTFVDGPRHDY